MPETQVSPDGGEPLASLDAASVQERNDKFTWMHREAVEAGADHRAVLTSPRQSKLTLGDKDEDPGFVELEWFSKDNGGIDYSLWIEANAGTFCSGAFRRLLNLCKADSKVSIFIEPNPGRIQDIGISDVRDMVAISKGIKTERA